MSIKNNKFKQNGQICFIYDLLLYEKKYCNLLTSVSGRCGSNFIQLSLVTKRQNYPQTISHIQCAPNYYDQAQYLSIFNKLDKLQTRHVIHFYFFTYSQFLFSNTHS